ncbi:Histidine--tRNA ligase, mitochondrial [Wickerhamiella sorbophila]|uniref:Histidine--tRNA ligase, mitochondrial n=1 Tax=Wickerhamiella sorbophila TaxID=45607 RepID=A0A2T0FFE5_9ASCO|nr:Histidine--tRNA ligase, mitochondrial [Wickerhamiella sorbophila]PRT53700.1 Histidine--tRNA ligase, mitochondrial [Wickerhamiella sorbophila]
MSQAAVPKSAGKTKFALKTPKGTKDWGDKDMVIRTKLFDTISSVFRRHGGVTIDTPVFELREVLTGKYGEDSKLIYNLEDQGGELTSLRYDLTVPFARYVAMNGIQAIKRFHIAKVYRRDQPAMTKGRMREFYQCDFDIAGVYESMVPDAEILSIVVQVLKEVGIPDFTVKVNHRKILDGIFGHCGVPEDKVRTISSAVDKLDKLPWDEVRKEMTEEKGLDGEIADKIGKYVQLKGTIPEMIEKLSSDEDLMTNESAKQGVEDFKTMLPYLEAFDVVPFYSFDLSLARGLDYYTGLIYEAVTAASAPPEEAGDAKKKKKKNDDDDASESVGVGSIAAGGRYDKLVGMFASKKNGDIPCVGISFGIERLFSIIKSQGLYDHLRPTATQVFILAFGGGPEWTGFLPERMKVAKKLWEAGIEAEFIYKSKPKLQKQFEAAEKSGCPLAVILGQEEFNKGVVKVKELGLGEQDKGVDISVDEMVDYVRKKLESF